MNTNNNKLKPLPRNGNLINNWEKYKKNFQDCLQLSRIRKSEVEKAGAYFIRTIGEYGFEIANELELLNESKDNIKDDISLEDLYQNIDKYCQLNSNLNLYRYRFFTAKQGKDDFETFVSSLKTMSKNCEFGDLTDNLIMIQIISGISDKNLQDTLCYTINDLDLDRTIRDCSNSKSKKLQKLIPEAKDSASIKSKDKCAKNTENRIGNTPTRKRHSTAKPKTDLKNVIPEDSSTAPKIPRKMSFSAKDHAESEAKSKLDIDNKEEHNSTEKNEADLEEITQKLHSPKMIKSQGETSHLKDYATSEEKIKFTKNKDEIKWEKGESSKTATNKFICKFCECNHSYGNCPSFSVICQWCGKRGHTAKKCWYNRLPPVRQRYDKSPTPTDE